MTCAKGASFITRVVKIMDDFILGQILSFIGVFFTLVSIFGKNKKNIVAVLLIGNIFYALSFLMLGGYSAFTSILILMIRNILDLKGKLNKYNISLICIGIICLGICFNKNSWFGILPITATVSFIVLASLSKSAQHMRLTFISVYAQWIIFNFHIKAYPMFVMDIITLTTTTIEYFRRKNKSTDDPLK